MVEICDRTGKTRARFQLPHVDPMHQLDCCATSYIVTTIRTFKDNGLFSTCMEGREGSRIFDR